MSSTASTETTVDEIAADIYRIHTPITLPFGAFSFNQYLIVDEAPLLFHTGLRRMFALTREAIARVMPPEKLRFVSLSHFEADECGALNEFLAIAPNAEPLCGQVAAMTSIGDVADRPPRALSDGESLSLGKHKVIWLDAPHLPHGWECGYLMDTTTSTFFCGDIFTQGGRGDAPITKDDILEQSEADRSAMDYYAHAKNTRAMLERLASLKPRTLACMHGSAWHGDGGGLLRRLADRLDAG
ncbi:MAG: MBL fold metallo-hydrolase [Alphaproteobacteria bacterium]|nr:MBL fold metallo-hydrolase [Alphaproteobacteria bacterium]